MYRVLTATEAPLEPDELRLDLQAVGLDVIEANADVDALARVVVKSAPDVVIAGSSSPSDQLFDAARLVSRLAPCPFVVFTADNDSSKIERAADSGIHAYVVEGYARHRLLSIVHVARAYFRCEQALKKELDEITQRYEERKQVDRAKGVLMRSRGMTEEAAFEVLRRLAMTSRQRLGVIASSVIDMASASEAVNRAGQLRMLSQRIVRCYAQALTPDGQAAARGGMADTMARVEANLVILRGALRAKNYGVQVTRTAGRWQEVAAICARTPETALLDLLDCKAEAMLNEADALTELVESSGLAANLHVLNVAGRQRMVCQRITKLCFLLALQPSAERLAELRELTGSFQAALDYLAAAPLSSEVIRDSLQSTTAQWRRMSTALGALQEAGALALISETSEQLLTIIERLAGHYEHAMQILIGDRIGRLR